MIAITQALVVDDSKSARYSLKKMLQKQGVEANFAESAGAALNLLENQKPDVIFMDHLMPGMDGFEATRAIKNNPETSHIPVVMCTSREGDTYEGEAKANGASAILPKPAPENVLIEILTKLSHTVELPCGEPKLTDQPHEQSAQERPAPTSQVIREVEDIFQPKFELALEQQGQALEKIISDRFEKLLLQLDSTSQDALSESLGDMRQELYSTLTTQISTHANELIKHTVRTELAAFQGPEETDEEQLTARISEQVSNTLEAKLFQRVQSTLVQHEQSLKSIMQAEVSTSVGRVQSMAIAGIATGLVALLVAIAL